MSDHIRTHLVFKLLCSECGGILNMSWDPPKNKQSDFSKGEPTGAAMVQSIITVHPCKCTLESQRKLDLLRDILKPHEQAEGNE